MRSCSTVYGLFSNSYLFNSEEILLHLIERCTDLKILEVPNVDGKTPLHEAAQFSKAEIVRTLLEHNVKVDPLKRADWTPLMLACTKAGPEALEVVKLLLHHDADLNLKNKVCKPLKILMIQY